MAELSNLVILTGSRSPNNPGICERAPDIQGYQLLI